MPDDAADVTETVAAIIREVDGNHELGAAALAEALVNRGVTVKAQAERRGTEHTTYARDGGCRRRADVPRMRARRPHRVQPGP